MSWSFINWLQIISRRYQPSETCMSNLALASISCHLSVISAKIKQLVVLCQRCNVVIVVDHRYEWSTVSIVLIVNCMLAVLSLVIDMIVCDSAPRNLA